MLRLLLIFCLILLKTTNISAEIISDLRVEGNNRVSNETIYIFSKIKRGDDVSNTDLNDALKRLYETNFFEDVKLSLDNNILQWDTFW